MRHITLQETEKMNRTIIYFGILVGIIGLLSLGLPQLSKGMAQAQMIQGTDTGQLMETYIRARGRFIENVGQYPQNICFVAPAADGWLLFFNDRVEYRISAMPLNKRIEDDNPERTVTFMSRKMSPAAADLTPVGHWMHTDTIMQFNYVVSLTGRGLRAERQNYFGRPGTPACVRDAPTWDTLLYSGEEKNISIFFENGHVICEEHEISAVHPSPSVWRPTSTIPVGYKPIPRIRRIGIELLQNMVYSTYLGGSDADAIAKVIPFGENRFILIGTTGSRDFPIVGDAYSPTLRGDSASIYSRDVYVICLDIKRNDILFSTYFGGWDLESLLAAAIDTAGNIVFAGSTWSDDLPVTANAWQPQYRGNGDGYIAALNSTGSELVFCSYIGGTGIENLKDMKIDEYGNIVITGLTDSWNYPTTPGVVQNSYGGGEDDIFVTKFNRDVSQLLFSTFVGGQGWDEGRSLRFTPEENILVAGYTNSNDFPVTEDALYGNRNAQDEGCVFILTPGGRRLLYSTYIAWNTHEDAWAANLDDDGVMTVFGSTSSTDLPVNDNSFQKRKGDDPVFHPLVMDFYILKFRLDSTVILACTYLGGSGNERYPNSLIPMSDGRVFISGTGNSVDYPVTEQTPMLSPDTYSAKTSFLSSDLSSLLMSTEIGGQDHTHVLDLLILDKHLILAGLTYASDFPTTAGSHQEKKKGEADAFFTILDLSSVLTGLTTPTVLPEATVLSQHYPEPARDMTIIPFSLSTPAHVSLSIHDLMGRRVLNVLEDHFDVGSHRATVSLGHLPPGSYIVRLLTARGMQSRMLHVF